MLVAGWRLMPQRAAVRGESAVVADLHLGYARARQQRGEAVPTMTVAEELEPLNRLIHEQQIRQVIVAGDLFEDGRRRAETEVELLAWIAAVGVQWIVVPGNHDRGLRGTRLSVRESVRLDNWLIVHGDESRPDGPVIQGHEHPWLRWRSGVEGPCFLVGEDHIVLPAFSRDAAGGNVRGQSRWHGYRAVVVAGDVVLDFGPLGTT